MIYLWQWFKRRPEKTKGVIVVEHRPRLFGVAVNGQMIKMPLLFPCYRVIRDPARNAIRDVRAMRMLIVFIAIHLRESSLLTQSIDPKTAPQLRPIKTRHIGTCIDARRVNDGDHV